MQCTYFLCVCATQVFKYVLAAQELREYVHTCTHMVCIKRLELVIATSPSVQQSRIVRA